MSMEVVWKSVVIVRVMNCIHLLKKVGKTAKLTVHFKIYVDCGMSVCIGWVFLQSRYVDA